MLEIKVVEGLYKLWDGIRERNPGLIVDNCCGGGTRLDLELLLPFLFSFGEPTARFGIMFSEICPPPRAQSDHKYESQPFCSFTVCATCNYDPYTVRSGFNGGLTINMDLRKSRFRQGRASQSLCRGQKTPSVFPRDFYRLINDGYDPYSWCSYQYNVPEENKGCVFVFRRDNSPYPVAAIGLKSLDPKKKYEVDFYYGYERPKPKFSRAPSS